MSALPLLTEIINTDFLKCPLCSSTYKGSVILPCLHSACLDCVRSYLLKLKAKHESDQKDSDTHKDKDVDKLQCPVCKKKGGNTQQGTSVDFDSLKPNYFLVSNILYLFHKIVKFSNKLQYFKISLRYFFYVLA